jgi:hypothetical protein
MGQGRQTQRRAGVCGRVRDGARVEVCAQQADERPTDDACARGADLHRGCMAALRGTHDGWDAPLEALR